MLASQHDSLLQFPTASGSISRSGTPQIQGTCSSKRTRLSSRNTPAPSNNLLPVWTEELQTWWARSVAQLTASCGFPYSWVENPQWIEFCSEWIPGAIPIFRKALANRWIPEEVERYRDITKKEASGSMATIQCDGWSGINFHHFVAFMITTELRKVSMSPSSPCNQTYLNLTAITSRFIQSVFTIHRPNERLQKISSHRSKKSVSFSGSNGVLLLLQSHLMHQVNQGKHENSSSKSFQNS